RLAAEALAVAREHREVAGGEGKRQLTLPCPRRHVDAAEQDAACLLPCGADERARGQRSVAGGEAAWRCVDALGRCQLRVELKRVARRCAAGGGGHARRAEGGY